VTGALLALREAIAEPKKLYPDGRWAKATLEVCLAILESDQEKRDMRLSQQTRGPW
jgi:phthalate 4,5-cis-dihydrodiol dehydrogenase